MWRAFVFAIVIACAAPAAADEVVQFEAARYHVGPLQQRLARERGETLPREPATMLTGYLAKPAGDGRFPAIVYLHGCLGLENFRREAAAAQFTGWGYVSFVVDSFATRDAAGCSRSCSASKSSPRGVAITISPSTMQPSGKAVRNAAWSSGK